MATTSNRPLHGHNIPGSSSGPDASGGNGSRQRPGAPKKRKKPNRFLGVVGSFLNFIFWIVLLSALVISYYVYQTINNMPTSVAAIENYKPTGHTLIYSADGAELADIFSQNRENVTIDKIPKNLINATVAIEDERFWTDNIGVDPRGIGRAIWRDFRSGDAEQGGSTIPQQLVRNLGIDGLTRKKTFERKIHEMVIANEIERNYSKQQILEMYLNEVYYGSGSYGVQAASQTYFGKSVDKLDLAQCAMIAGLPQRPTGYSPYTNKDAAETRRNTVLARMRELGYITPDKCQSSIDEPIRLAFAKAPPGRSRTFYGGDLTNYFIDYVVNNLIKEYGSDYVYRGGIKVYTTLNLAMQHEAAQDVEQNVASLGWANVSQAALVCIEPQTGYIKAMVGGTNYKANQFNIAVDGLRQPGSSFKPIYYTAALDTGALHEDDQISDDPIDLPGADHGHRWRPQEDDGHFHGMTTATNALAQSYNCASVRVFEKVGVDTAIRYAHLMGVHSPLEPYVTLALGASGVTPLEMADVYATIHNGGARPIVSGITEVVDDSGQVVENDSPKLETTGITQQACTQMSNMLRAVVTGGTASASFRDNNPPDAVGKTGTTQNHHDVWFDGYTHDLVTVVWAGHPSMRSRSGRGTTGQSLSRDAWGATVTVPMWKQFMIAAEGIEVQEKAREAAQHTVVKPVIVSRSAQDSPDQNDSSNDNTSQDDNTPASSSDNNNTDDSNGANTDSTPESSSASNSDNSDDSQSTDANDTSGTTTGAPNPTTDQTPIPVSTPIAAPQKVIKQTYVPAPALPLVHRAPPSSSAEPRMVTVSVCAETGLLATRWCPETVDETFIAGQQPKRHCTIHHAPPGE